MGDVLSSNFNGYATLPEGVPDTWSRGRVVLIGNAVHMASLSFGFGLRENVDV